MNIVLTILGILAPAWAAWFMYRRSQRLAARTTYLEDALRRRQAAAEVKVAIALEEQKARTEVAAKHAAQAEVIKDEEEAIIVATKTEGKAKAASDHVKRLRNTAKLVFLAFALWSADAHATPRPCQEGVTLMAGQRIDCDAECLPADDLDFLLERSTRLMKVENDCARAKGEHEAALIAATKRYDQCMGDYVSLEKSCEKAVTSTADTISPSTYVLVAVGIFVVGMVAGGAAYHALRANAN
jgi:hypothetical protein